MKKINKIFLLLIAIFAFGIITPVNAQDIKHKPPTVKELKQLDQKIADRLELTDDQIKNLRAHKAKNFKEMQKTIEKMEVLRKNIHDVYIIGIPKFQADIRTAAMKMELAILKQNADKIRYENRKYFESILTPEQKIKFESLKAELLNKRNN